MMLTSPAFRDGDSLPRSYTQDAENFSPPFEWLDAPSGCRSFALICEDPDAPAATPAHPFIHWMIYDIPANLSSLPQDIPTNDELTEPLRCKQGRNSLGDFGYAGPLPPLGRGPHRYIFTLFALNTPSLAESGADWATLSKGLGRHATATARIMGKYERPAKSRALSGQDIHP